MQAEWGGLSIPREPLRPGDYAKAARKELDEWARIIPPDKRVMKVCQEFGLEVEDLFDVYAHLISRLYGKYVAKKIISDHKLLRAYLLQRDNIPEDELMDHMFDLVRGKETVS